MMKLLRILAKLLIMISLGCMVSIYAQAETINEETIKLLKGLKSHGHIHLTNLTFDLSIVKDFVAQRKKEKKISLLIEPDYVFWSKQHYPLIKNLKHVVLDGTKGSAIVIEPSIVDDGLGCVMEFNNCEDVSFENIKFGHINKKQKSTAGILRFNDCKNIQLINTDFEGIDARNVEFNNCDNVSILNSRFSSVNARVIRLNNCNNVQIRKCHLDGSGAGGIEIFDSENVVVDSSIITTTWDFTIIYNSKQISFTNTRFEKGHGSEHISIGDSKHVLFYRCSIINNQLNNYKSYLFFIDHKKIYERPQIKLRDCVIKGNRGGHLVNKVEDIVLINCEKTENEFEDFYERSDAERVLDK